MLFFDLHSYTDEIVPANQLQGGKKTPDVCIGTEHYYTPGKLIKNVRKCFEEAGFTTALNYPYSGCFVPDTVMAGISSCDCAAVMIELNRRIYCDESGNSDPVKMNQIQEIMRKIIELSVNI